MIFKYWAVMSIKGMIKYKNSNIAPMAFLPKNLTSQQTGNQNSKLFHSKIRTRHIEQIKHTIRCYYPLVINYSDPSGTIDQLEEIILFFGSSYIPIALQVINEVIIENYELSKLLAMHRILEKILIKLLNKDEDYVYIRNRNECLLITDLITECLKTMKRCVEQWDIFWKQMMENFWEVLWGLVVDFHWNEEMVRLIGILLAKKEGSYQDHNESRLVLYWMKLTEFLEEPMIIDILAQNITDAVVNRPEFAEQICSKIYLINNPAVINSYLKVLSKLQFIDEQTLQQIHSAYFKCPPPQKQAILKILYEQMFLTDNEVLDYANQTGNITILTFVEQLLQNDY